MFVWIGKYKEEIKKTQSSEVYLEAWESQQIELMLLNLLPLSEYFWVMQGLFFFNFSLFC